MSWTTGYTPRCPSELRLRDPVAKSDGRPVQTQGIIRRAPKNLFFFSKSFLHNTLDKCCARACRTHTACTELPRLDESQPKFVGNSDGRSRIRRATSHSDHFPGGEGDCSYNDVLLSLDCDSFAGAVGSGLVREMVWYAPRSHGGIAFSIWAWRVSPT